MSSLSGCLKRPDFDKYATTKSGGQLMLAAGLIANTISELYNLVQAGPGSARYYYAVVSLLSTSLAIQVIIVLTSIALGMITYPSLDETTANENEMHPKNTPHEINRSESEVTKGKLQTPAGAPPVMKIMNDIVTYLTMLVAVILVIKNGLLNPGSIKPVIPTAPSADV